MKKSLVYLATPYSHPDPDVQQERFEQVNIAAAVLMAHGLHIYSPISHTHPIAKAGELPGTWDYWEKYDTAILKCCKAMIVYKLQGWEVSKGVRAETVIANEMAIPVFYLSKARVKRIGVEDWLESANLKPATCNPINHE